MHNIESLAIYDAVEEEVQRTTYPPSFPPLPAVPTGRYIDSQFFDLEMQHVWHKTWLTAGHISELPKPGSYKLFEKLGQSIIISRGLDDEVRAFHNICRHRGAALLQEPTGTERRFVCPYHSWGYAIDGKLVSVPEAHNFACLEKSENGLLPVRCETWRGMIFINLDDDALPLAEFFAPITAETADFPFEDLVVKDTVVVEMDCNWKAAYDNFLEIYHVNSIHKDTLAPYLDSKSFVVSLFKGGHARFVTRKKRGDTIFGTGLTLPHETTERFKDHTVGLPFFPNGFTALDPIGFAWQTFWPVGPRKTIMEAPLLGWKIDTAEDRQFWTDTKANTLKILAEDTRLFAGIQRSLESGFLPSVMMGCQERALYWYQEEIDRKIGQANIPEHLRVTPVLEEHVGAQRR